MKTFLHEYDLPNDVVFGQTVAIDTEAMGLNQHRDRLCLVQLTFDGINVHLVQFPEADFSKSPNLKKLLTGSTQKIFHFARFDVAILQYSLKCRIQNVYCTKVASHLVRTFTHKHGLKDVVHLHSLKLKLDAMLTRENRHHLANATFEYLPFRAELDLFYGQKGDLMAYKIEDQG